MAHGLEARVPFLDREVIAWALRLPAEAEGRRPGRPRSGCCARRSTAGCPTSCCGGRRPQFGDGSGARDVLTDAIEAGITDEEFEGERDAVDPPLRTTEELAYYRIWREHLPGVRAERTLGRFATA